jgi:hypothetical protein
LITDRQIGKFASAGERTWVAEYGYDLVKVGVPGLKATATYLKGTTLRPRAATRASGNATSVSIMCCRVAR